ncbi:YfhD family protein [Chengkuizengella marina]|nr:YfhD family protein [Chengkuizengella marina]
MDQKKPEKRLPIAKNEDVEFSESLADEDDLEAQKRAKEADQRQINK